MENRTSSQPPPFAVVPADDTRCPYCNRDMGRYSQAHIRKHLARCRNDSCRRRCTGRPVGRPAKRKPIRTPPKE